MKNLKNKTMIKIKLFALLLLVFPILANAQDEKPLKNNLIVSYGISIPNFTSNPEGQVFASNGSDVSFAYSREVYLKNNTGFALELKFSKIKNGYDNLDADKRDISSSLPSTLGSWNASSGNYQLSSYLLGGSWIQYLSKSKKANLYLKIYAGSGSLISPNENFESTSGFFVNLNEAKSNSFVYSTSAGVSFKLSKHIFLGVDLEYLKGSFLFENQVINIDNQNSSFRDSYIIDYNNITLNTSLNFKF